MSRVEAGTEGGWDPGLGVWPRLRGRLGRMNGPRRDEGDAEWRRVRPAGEGRARRRTLPPLPAATPQGTAARPAELQPIPLPERQTDEIR